MSLGGGVRVEHELHDPRAVTEVDEDQAAVVTTTVHPSGHFRLGPGPIARELGVGETSLGYWVARDRDQRVAADPDRLRRTWPNRRRSNGSASVSSSWKRSVKESDA